MKLEMLIKVSSFVKSCLFLGLALGSSACGMQLQKDDPGNPGSNPNPVHLERHTQRVVRYNCAGQFVSDQIEVVKKANKWVKVEPNFAQPIVDSSFKNRQSGDSADMIVGHKEFQIKYSNGDLGMKVQPGLNIVDYKFFDCSTAQSGSCPSTGRRLQEAGTVSLQVTYEEKHLEGTLEVRESCPQPSPKP